MDRKLKKQRDKKPRKEISSNMNFMATSGASFECENNTSSDDLHESEKNQRPEIDFSSTKWKADVSIVAGGQKIPASRTVLTFMSPVLSAQLGDNSAMEIELLGKDPSDVKEFLACLYPDILRPITEENVYRVLQLAGEYQVEVLKERCSQFLTSRLDSNSTAEDVYKFLRQASAFKMHALRNKCVGLASQLDTKDVAEVEKKFPLHAEDKCAVQQIQMSMLTENVHKLSLQLAESKDRCVDLEKAVKALFTADGGNKKQDLNKIGIMKMELVKGDPLKAVCKTLLINKLTWELQASIDEKSCLSLDLRAKLETSDQDWRCNVNVKFRILSQDPSCNHYWKYFSGALTSENPCVSIRRFMYASELWSPKYADGNNTSTLELFFLVDDVYAVITEH